MLNARLWARIMAFMHLVEIFLECVSANFVLGLNGGGGDVCVWRGMSSLRNWMILEFLCWICVTWWIGLGKIHIFNVPIPINQCLFPSLSSLLSIALPFSAPPFFPFLISLFLISLSRLLVWGAGYPCFPYTTCWVSGYDRRPWPSCTGRQA